MLAHVRVAALLEQSTQAAVSHVADVDVSLTVEPIDHLLRRPAAHAGVLDGHTEGVTKVRGPRCVLACVLGERRVPGGERVAIAEHARWSDRLHRKLLNARRTAPALWGTSPTRRGWLGRQKRKGVTHL